MANLNVNFCGVNFGNPLILPSGIIQEIPDHKRAIDAGVGGITLKTLTPLPREGNPIPRVARYDYGVINSVGFRNPGIEKGAIMVKNFLEIAHVPVIVSLFAYDIEGYCHMAKKISQLNPQFIEVDISCPNVTCEFGEALGKNKKAAAEVVATVKKETGEIPVIIKLAADAIGVSEIAHACEEAGADAICATNTIGQGMLIDIKTKKSMLGNKFGGVGGPGIKPFAVKCIFDIYNAVKIPIIGMGGVVTWQDVVEMMMVGASLVGIGSATYFKGMKIFEEVKQGLVEYMKKERISNLNELVGVAHDII